MANMKGILKIVSGIVTVGTGAVVALKGLKSRKEDDFEPTMENEAPETEEAEEPEEVSVEEVEVAEDSDE